MSYDVRLIDAQTNEVVSVTPHQEGGTYVLGGDDRARLNVTYNYYQLFHMAGLEDSLRTLNGERAADVVPLLEKAVEFLGTRQYKDYWAPTPGNAGHALSILIGWAKQYPDAVFEVD